MELTDADLRDFAETQVAYEVRTLLAQVDTVAAMQRNKVDPVYMALVEASLVHLRLLDEFLRKAPDHDDVAAEYYLPGRIRRGFLKDSVRRAINGQVQHLAMRRTAGVDWDLVGVARAFARCFLEFVADLADEEGLSHRVEWFTESAYLCFDRLDSSEWDQYEGALHGS